MRMQKPFEPPDFFTKAFVICVILSTFWFAVSKSASSPSRSLFCESISSLIPRLNWPNLNTDPPRASRLSSCLFRLSYCNCWLDLPLVSLSSYSPVGKLLYFWDISESWSKKKTCSTTEDLLFSLWNKSESAISALQPDGASSNWVSPTEVLAVIHVDNTEIWKVVVIISNIGTITSSKNTKSMRKASKLWNTYSKILTLQYSFSTEYRMHDRGGHSTPHQKYYIISLTDQKVEIPHHLYLSYFFVFDSLTQKKVANSHFSIFTWPQ